MKKVSKNNKFLFYELDALDPPPEARADPNHSWWSEARTAASDARDLGIHPTRRPPPAGPALDRRPPDAPHTPLLFPFSCLASMPSAFMSLALTPASRSAEMV